MKPNLFLSLVTISIICFTASCKKSTDAITPPPTSDSFTVTVNNGYGSGTYKVGDTVHIFSNPVTLNQVFDKWSGDISPLESADEWHTWFIMPNKNINVTGSIKSIAPFTMQFAQIMGRDRLKPVYYYFPAGHKGIVYILHGTNGSAAAIMAGYEWQLMIRDLVSNQYAVIITECEETTVGADSNGDGKIRWFLTPNDTTTNVDLANIRIITDSFYNAGLTNRSIPRYSMGMSDGGYFSASLANAYQFKTSVQYCSPGSSYVMGMTSIPTQFCMAQNDNNPSIGPAGNAQALTYSNTLNGRGVCSKYFIHPRSPIYPERFARDGNLTVAQSVNVFNELKSKGYIDSKNYYIGFSDGFISAYSSSPASFPVYNALSIAQKTSVLAEINLSVADHHMFSDYNRASLKFLNTQCH